MARFQNTAVLERWVWLIEVGIVAFLYYVTGRVGVLWAIPPGIATPVWPPSGIALAAVLFRGRRIWPGIWLGSVAVNLGTLFNGESIATALVSLAAVGAIGVGSFVQALVGGALLGRFIGNRSPFGRAQDVFKFVGLAMLSCLVSPSFGAASVAVAGGWAEIVPSWWTWWVGDLLGILVVTSLLITWHYQPWPRWQPRRLVESTMVLGATILVAHVVFSDKWAESIVPDALAYALIPCSIWAAVRFGPRGVATLTLVMAVLAIGRTSQGLGPLSGDTMNLALLKLQAFVGIVATTSLVLAAALTEKDQVQLALRESEERFRQLAENIPQVFWISDPRQLRTLYVSPAFEEVWGRPRESAFERDGSFVDAIHPDDQKGVRAALAQQQRGEVTATEYRVVRPDGSVRWIFDRGFPVKDQAGDVYRTVGLAEDITERKQAQERFRLAVEASPTGMLLVDQRGRIVLVNSQVSRLFGHQAEELLGQPVELLVPARFRERHPAYRDQFFAAPQSRSMGAGRDLYGQHRDGAEIPIEIALNPITIGKELFILASVIDITERKRAQVDLQRAKEAAEAANRAKSEFLANVSHEIRTPLNGILGMTELVLDTDLAPRQREYLSLAKLSAGSLMNVINDLLDFAKIEAGKLDLHTEPFLLRDGLDLVLKALALRAHKKGLELSCRVAADVPDALVGDPNRLWQIVVNLVGNAIKFTERGGATLHIDVLAQTAQEAALHFTVTDTGIGIPADKLRRIFQPFEQAEPSTTRKYEGTGLGLAIASQLIALMGGRIWVESTVGKGSTFHFTVRCGLASSMVNTTAGSATETDGQRRMPLQSVATRAPARCLRVLVAEDNAINQVLTQELLTQRGHEVRLANNGLEALSAWKEGSVDVLLLDVQMPGMSGFEVATQIRAEEQKTGGHLRIVALTARAMKGDRERCLEAGMDGYLSKPIQLEDLFAMVEGVEERAGDTIFASPVFSEPFDREALLARLRGNTALLKQMAKIFLEASPQWLEEIRSAIARGDAHQVGETAHVLKGSVGHFEAAAAVAAASRLETMGRANNLTEADAVLKDLENSLSPLCTALAQLETGDGATSER
jgi:PAS domain S-box-containing protein